MQCTHVSQFLRLDCVLYVTALEAYWCTEASAALLLSFKEVLHILIKYHKRVDVGMADQVKSPKSIDHNKALQTLPWQKYLETQPSLPHNNFLNEFTVGL